MDPLCKKLTLSVMYLMVLKIGQLEQLATKVTTAQIFWVLDSKRKIKLVSKLNQQPIKGCWFKYPTFADSSKHYNEA